MYDRLKASEDCNLLLMMILVMALAIKKMKNLFCSIVVNLLKPNDIYVCRTAALTSRRFILNIYSKNIHTEYFKHAA